jgi:hypothetical protein
MTIIKNLREKLLKTAIHFERKFTNAHPISWYNREFDDLRGKYVDQEQNHIVQLIIDADDLEDRHDVDGNDRGYVRIEVV